MSELESFDHARARSKPGARPPEEADLPPYSVVAEEGVISCCLRDPLEAVPLVAAALEGDVLAFYDIRLRELWATLHKLHEARRGIDLITVGQAIKDEGKNSDWTYLSDLYEKAPSSVNLPYYLEILKEKRALRRMAAVAGGVLADIKERPDEVERIANQFAAAAADVMSPGVEHGRPIDVEFPAIMQDLEDFRQGKKVMAGLETGLNYLDLMLCGLKREEYLILAGRPGGGKTALGLQIAEHVAVALKRRVGIFSLEMSRKALAARLVFGRAGVNYQKYRNGFLKHESPELLAGALAELKGAGIIVDDTSGLSVEALAMRARQMVREHGVELFLIDYLQLMAGRAGVRYGSDMLMRVADSSDGLLALRKELGVPLLVLAQENSNREKSTGERKPMLSDLKDSQKPAQDADVVMFIYDVDTSKVERNQNSPDEGKRKQAEAELKWLHGRGTLHLPAAVREGEEGGGWQQNLKRVNVYIAKQRNGATGDCQMVMVKPWMRFIDPYTPPKHYTSAQDEFAAGLNQGTP